MKPVHTYMQMVQCPVCHYTYMEQGDLCCWRCSPAKAAPSRAELAAAYTMREAADIEAGSPGSLLGLGFAPMGTPVRVFDAPKAHRETGRPLSRPRLPFSIITRALAVVGWLVYAAYLVFQSAWRHGLPSR